MLFKEKSRVFPTTLAEEIVDSLKVRHGKAFITGNDALDAEIIVEDVLRNTQYRVYYRDKKKKPTFLMRLTLPFYGLLAIAMLIYSPFKYLFKGTRCYDDNKGVGRFYKLWSSKLNF